MAAAATTFFVGDFFSVATGCAVDLLGAALTVELGEDFAVTLPAGLAGAAFFDAGLAEEADLLVTADFEAGFAAGFDGDF
jgi:hypothetical protein